MYDKIIQLWFEGCSEAEIAEELGIPYYMIEDVLNDYYDGDYDGWY